MSLARAVVETLEERALFSVYTVTNTADGGAGSLRQAMLDANKHAGADEIRFDIGTGAQSIRPSSALPFINGPVTIDGTTQRGYAGKPLVEIDGSRIGGKANGFSVGGGSSIIRGLVINRFSGSGVLLDGGNNLVAANYIGLDASGTRDLGNGEHGVLVISANNRVGGTSDADGNVISGNHKGGVFLYGGKAARNIVQGNHVGTNASGTSAIANDEAGVGTFYAWGNTIGGTARGAGNLISGNKQDGVVINGKGGDGNIIQGNLVGVDATGTKAIANGLNGIEVNTTNNLVGGESASARNVVSGNLNAGVVLWLKSSTGNRVQGNYIGTDITGTQPIGNAWGGVDISNGPSGNLIGGASAATRNIIAGNLQRGVGIYSGSTDNRIQGNYIGTDVSGTKPLSNWGDGVIVAAQAGKNLIGGSGEGEGNLISTNANGIGLSTSNGTTIMGNLIGTDASGTRKLGSGYQGIWIGSSNNTIGGVGARAGNVIAGSGQSGIQFNSGGNNKIIGNRIGVGPTGKAMGNTEFGINLNGSSGNLVSNNEVAYNGRHGVSVGSGSRNQVSANSIHDNVGQGINLSFSGSNPNDAMDADGGGNGLQNFPVIRSAVGASNRTALSGSLQSSANQSYTIEFFAVAAPEVDGFGEGQIYLGSVSVKTNSSGSASFITSAAAAPKGYFIASTATSSDGNTSEFSKAIKLVGGSAETLPVPLPPPESPGAPSPSVIRMTAAGTGYRDASRNTWSAPSGFSGGTERATDVGGIGGTSDDTLFSARRFGEDFTFSQAVANGSYVLHLLFADPCYDSAGARVFSVSAEGEAILKNYDIAADVGVRRAVTKTFTLNITDGRLDLRFFSSVENAIVSAIELVPE